MPSLLILIPLFTVILMNLFAGTFARRFAFWFAASLFVTQILLALYHHPIFWQNRLSELDSFFKVPLSVDHMSFVVLLCIGIVSLASLTVSRYAIYEEIARFKFINLLILGSIGMCGVVMVNDMFSLYVFLEITAVVSFILIAFQRDIFGLEGAFKYLMLSSVATIMMLSATAILLIVSHDTSFVSLHKAVSECGGNWLVAAAVALFLCGLFIKAGLVPFHGWLPDAYTSAPAPVSVLLAGIVTKAAGVYTLMRVSLAVFGMSEPVKNLLLAIGAASILIGAIAAIGQNDFKRMLSYSSISQVGYIILGFGTGTALGMIAAMFHLFNHSIFNSLLFVNQAAVEIRTGTSDMNKIGGLTTKMPVTGTTSVIAILSTCGIPPMAGFWSKLMIIFALWQGGRYGYAVVAVLAGILTLTYMLSMQRRLFFGKATEGLETVGEAGPGLIIVSVALALITIGTGVFFPYVFAKILLPFNIAIPR